MSTHLLSSRRATGARPGVLLPALGLSAAVLLLLLRWVDPGHDAVDQLGPLARLAMHVAGVLTVGWLSLAALVLDRSGGALSGSQRHCLRLAGVAARAWALAAAAAWLVAVLSAQGVDAQDASGVAHEQGRSWGLPLLVAVVAAVLVAVSARRLRTADAANVLLALAVAGVVLPVAAAHTGAAHGDPGAIVAVSVHVASGSVWVGGLLALLALLRAVPDVVEEALPRFSGLALLCVAALGASGLLTAATRVDGPAALTGTDYGRLVLLKALLLVVVCALGVRQRRTVLPGLPERGVTVTFARLATVEVVVLTVVLAVGAALSHAGAGH